MKHGRPFDLVLYTISEGSGFWNAIGDFMCARLGYTKEVRDGVRLINFFVPSKLVRQDQPCKLGVRWYEQPYTILEPKLFEECFTYACSVFGVTVESFRVVSNSQTNMYIIAEFDAHLTNDQPLPR